MEESSSKTTQPESPLAYDVGLEGLTVFEKKAHLVNRELDGMGMGKYQWMIFGLCGFGYLLDLLWAQAFGLVVAPLQQELGFSDGEVGNIVSAFAVGLTAGAFVWGILVDIIGRMWAFNFTVLITSVFGLCLGIPSSYGTILLVTSLVGFGVGGNIPIDTTITLEFIPQDRRYLLPLLSVFQPVGVVICSALAYAWIPSFSCNVGLKSCRHVSAGEACCTKADNHGWRYFLFTLGGITLVVFFLRFVVFRFQESPKYLLHRQKDAEAVRVMQEIARYNNRTSAITLEMLTSLADTEAAIDEACVDESVSETRSLRWGKTYRGKLRIELDRYQLFFRNATVARLTLLIWTIYIFDFWGFSIAGGLLPYILQKKSEQAGLSTESIYRAFVYIYLFGIPGVLLGARLYRGRQLAMLISSALMSASLFVFTTVDTIPKYIGIGGLEYFFQSMFNAVLYGWTAEAYPAPIRGTATGVASFWGRLSSIIAPVIGQRLLQSSYDAPLYLGAAGVLIATLSIALLPTSYIGAESF